MVPNLNNLVRVKKSHIKPVAEMLARAYQDAPLFTYFIPDASERRIKLPYFLQFLIRYNVLYGEVYATSTNLEGIAGWLPSEKANMSFWRMIRSGLLSLIPKVGREVLERPQHFDEYYTPMYKCHTPFRHWVLHLIGVDPILQGKGYAGTLLKAMFARIDEEHLPCYLTTSTEKNVSLYQHYGFKVIEKSVIPDTEVSLWAMLREKSSELRTGSN